MRRAILPITALALALGPAAGAREASADSALIQTAAPLADDSRDAVDAAFTAAMERAAIGASAMGYTWLQLRHARVVNGHVAVQVLATDDEPGGPDEDAAGAGDPAAPPEALDPYPPDREAPGLPL